MTETAGTIRIQVRRFDPEKSSDSWIQPFTVETAEPLSVMALLAKIHEQDESFACRTSICYKGQCGSCLVRVNGKDVLGCVTMVRPGEVVALEPHSQYHVLRDLVVDFSLPSEG